MRRVGAACVFAVIGHTPAQAARGQAEVVCSENAAAILRGSTTPVAAIAPLALNRASHVPICCHSTAIIRTKEQGEMAACSCGQADLFARGPDQVAGAEELFGRCNLVRLAGEKVQRNPDHLEVRQAAERFKAALRQLVLPKELPDNLEVKGAGKIDGPPGPGPEPFEHLLRQIGLEALANSGRIEIPDAPEVQPRLPQNAPLSRANKLLKRVEISRPSRLHKTRWGGVEVNGGSGQDQAIDLPDYA